MAINFRSCHYFQNKWIFKRLVAFQVRLLSRETTGTSRSLGHLPLEAPCMNKAAMFTKLTEYFFLSFFLTVNKRVQQ